MDLSQVKGETWSPMGNGEERSLPLFKKDELEKAEIIVKQLEGLTIISAQELLNKVSIAISQLAVI
jgi:hypothetical protein